jgi:glycosyltransferase involved in cell wall biosynthesis
MPELKVFYITGYNIAKNSGRNKATREKARVLRKLLTKGAFAMLYPGTSHWRLVAYLKAFFFDLTALVRLLFVGKNIRVIQRTTFLPLTNSYLRLRGVKVIYELHTDFRDEIKHYHVSWPEKMVLYGYSYVERFNLRLAGAIIYNHPVLQELMKNKYRKPSICSYNGANVEDFFPMEMNACRAELGLHADLKYYLFAGALAKWRGVDLLINIFNDYMEENDVLLIVGNADHEYGFELKKKANSKNVLFKSEVEVKEIVKWINAADICLVPVKPVLKSPGNPLKLYDYISCGKPIAGQENVTGCSDEILKYDVGIVTDFFDPARAASDIKTFCLNHNAAFYMDHNRNVAINEVSWEKRITEWINFLKN